MTIVILTALGVGGATVIGAIIGFLFKNISHKFSDIVLAFAAGVMLAAAVLGLIMPSVEHGQGFGTPIALLMTVAGVFTGAFCLNLIDKLVPHLHKMVGTDIEDHQNSQKAGKVLLGDKDVTNVPAHKLVPMGVAQVPEGRRIFQELTVAENLRLGYYTRRDKQEMEATLESMYARFPILKERYFLVNLPSGLVRNGTKLPYPSVCNMNNRRNTS